MWQRQRFLKVRNIKSSSKREAFQKIFIVNKYVLWSCPGVPNLILRITFAEHLRRERAD